MAAVLLIVVSFLGGALARRFKVMPENAHLAFNQFVIYVSLPGLVIKSLRFIPMTPAYFSAALMPWIVFLLAAFLFLTLERLRVFDRNTALALVMTAGLANTSFVGIPLIQALYGVQYVSVGVIIDQMGTFLVMCLVVIPLVDFLRVGEFSMRVALRSLLLFPPFIALLFAFAFQVFKPIDMVFTIAGHLGDTLTPVALFSVGLQWHAKSFKKYAKELSIGLIFKLVAAPVIIYFFYAWADYHRDLRKIVVLEAAMGPMITGSIIAMQKNLNPQLVSAMLSVGIPLSIVGALVVKFFFK